MSDAVTIRRLHSADINTARAACRTFGWDGALDPGPFLSDSPCHLFVAEAGSAVLGWVYGHERIHPDGERTMLLYSLDVVDGARRRGIGRALTETFVEHARSRGATEVWVLTETDNDGGQATYRAAGARRDLEEPVMFTWELRPGRHSS